MAFKLCSVLFVAYLATGVNCAAVTPSAPDNATVPVRGGKQIPSLPGPVVATPTGIVEEILKLVCDALKGLLNCPCGDAGSPPPPDGSLTGLVCSILDLVCPGCPKGGPVQLPAGLGLEGIIQSLVQLLKNLLGGISPAQASSLENKLNEAIALLTKLIKLLENQPFPNSNTILQPNMISCPPPLYQ